MHRVVTFPLVIITSLFLYGCDRLPGAGAQVPATLVVDSVSVAKSLGRDERMQRQLSSALEQLNAQLQQHSGELSAQVEKEKEKLGSKPNDAELEKFRGLAANASQSLQQSQQLARQKVAEYRETLLSEFNAELRAVAADIAKDKGATTVMVLGTDVLWFDPAADITGEVIAKLRAQDAQSQSAPTTPDGATAEQQQELRKLESLVDKIEQQQQSKPQPEADK